MKIMMTEKSQKTQKSLPKSIISLSIIAWFCVIGVGVFSLNTIINPQKLNSEKGISETEVPPELIISESPEETKKSNLSFLTLIILLLVCSGGSLLVTYILRILVTSEPQKTPVKRNKKVPKTATPNPSSQAVSSTVTLIPAQESTPVEKKNYSLVEIMDLRKRHSLVSIMDDN